MDKVSQIGLARLVSLAVILGSPLSIRATPALAQESKPASSSGRLEGHPAPDFTLKTLAGERVRLADLRGHPVLLNFWASWCKPCTTEMPLILAAYDSLRDRGLTVLAINLADQDRRQDAQRFVASFQLPFDVLRDEHGEVWGRYRLVAVPTTVFVDSAGSVRRVVSGPVTNEILQRGLIEILPP